jgi:hypothetical protein
MMNQFEVIHYMHGMCITECNPEKYSWHWAWGYTRIVKWLSEPVLNGTVMHTIDKGMI